MKPLLKKPVKKHMTTTGFILVSLGSAIGLGNILRFPMLLAKHGGATFLIPLLLSIIIIGAPLLYLEIAFGNKWRRGSVKLLTDLTTKPKWLATWFGWFQTFNTVLLMSFYIMLIGWTLSATLLSLGNQMISAAPEKFSSIINNGSTTNKQELFASNFSPYMLLCFLAVVAFIFFLSWGGKLNFFEKICSIMVVALFFILIILTIYSICLPKATLGLEKMFTPDWNKLSTLKIWSDAAVQAIFSIGVGISGYIFCSKNAKKSQHFLPKTLTIVAGDTLAALFAGMFVFSIIGFKGGANDVDALKKIAESSEKLGYAFTFQYFFEAFQNINAMTKSYSGNVISFLFFTSVVFAGLSSLIVMQESLLNNISENTTLKRPFAFKSIGAWLVVVGTSLSIGSGYGKNIIDSLDDGFCLNVLIILISQIIIMGNSKFYYQTFHTKKTNIDYLMIFKYFLMSAGILILLIVFVIKCMIFDDQTGKLQNVKYDYNIIAIIIWFILTIVMPTVMICYQHKWWSIGDKIKSTTSQFYNKIQSLKRGK